MKLGLRSGVAAAILSFSSIAAGGITSAAHAEGPKVVATLKPIHSLVASVMQGVGEPTLIVEGASSPHGFSLKPSQMAAVQDADMVFWVGPMMETFLVKPLENVDPSHAVELAELPGMRLMNYDEDHDHDHEHEHDHDHADGDGHDHDADHDHEHEHEEDHADHDADHDHEMAEGEEHHHHHSGVDGHLWLDPENAIAIADGVADALSTVDPDNAVLYKANAAKLRADLSAQSEQIAATLAPVAGRGFIVFHDAYQYFESRYGLDAAGSVTVNPEVSPSAAHIAEMQDRIRDSGAVCVFSEPQFPAKMVDVVTEGMSLNRAVLDPLGATLEPGPALYGDLIGALADSFARCLGSGS
ncbi:zinc ABC transporter solute-binding protein [Rhodospirillaceae bacterium KN72]|uniref:High-affinity zinc uptake system protein ZnuA n=1 Tax=Pacificispira spongiicola TaxID=2729598 RepID=A0A7Y0HFQ4_9PROT|nr:zinc ABC transporter substrate-binding protein [Pacificispira spongiicola]NMM44843.1 zinc ABC transporter solute-binding protein [Pacificispira spongiicola]